MTFAAEDSIERRTPRRSFGERLLGRIAPAVVAAEPALVTEQPGPAATPVADAEPAQSARTPEEIFAAACRAIAALKSRELTALEAELKEARSARQAAHQALTAAIHADQARHIGDPAAEPAIIAATEEYDRHTDHVAELRRRIAELRPGHAEMVRGRLLPTVVANAERIGAAAAAIAEAWALADQINAMTERELGQLHFAPQCPRVDLGAVRSAAARFTKAAG